MYQDKISDLHREAQLNGINTNKDGSYDKRSHLGKEIQEKLVRLHRNSTPPPSEPSYTKWRNFNDLWEAYNYKRESARASLWAFYGLIISVVLVEWFTDAPINWVTFLLAGIGTMLSFRIGEVSYKDVKHNILSPERVTLENIDTHIEPKRSINLCRTIKCLLKELGVFGNKGTSLDLVNFPSTNILNMLGQKPLNRGLERLRVSNQLTELPKEIGQLTNLTRLNLNSNKLTELPKEIGQLIDLTELDLFNNKLTELPKEIGQLTNLTRLNLNSNKLTELPKEIGQLTNLTTLILKNNQLSELPKEIIKLTNLNILNTADNANLNLTSVQIEWLEKLEDNDCRILR